MSISTLLRELQEKGIAIRAEGDQIKIKRASLLTPEMREGLIENKPVIVEWLRFRDSLRTRREELIKRLNDGCDYLETPKAKGEDDNKPFELWLKLLEEYKDVERQLMALEVD